MRFESLISGLGSDYSTNCTTTPLRCYSKSNLLEIQTSFISSNKFNRLNIRYYSRWLNCDDQVAKQCGSDNVKNAFGALALSYKYCYFRRN